MSVWPVQDAKARLSEVIDRARNEGPQTITRHGREHAVVVSMETYRSLTEQRPDFVAYLLGGPKCDEFMVEREPDFGRAVEPATPATFRIRE